MDTEKPRPLKYLLSMFSSPTFQISSSSNQHSRTWFCLDALLKQVFKSSNQAGWRHLNQGSWYCLPVRAQCCGCSTCKNLFFKFIQVSLLIRVPPALFLSLCLRLSVSLCLSPSHTHTHKHHCIPFSKRREKRLTRFYFLPHLLWMVFRHFKTTDISYQNFS